MVHEVVAVFDNADSLRDSIDELRISGFDRSDLSLLANEHAIEEKMGHLYTKATDLEDDPDTPTIAYISPEAIGDAEGALIATPMYFGALAATGVMIAVGGPLAATFAVVTAAAGASALIGGVLARLVGKHHSQYLQNQLDHGGLLLWVHTRDDEHEEKAKEILSRHSAHDVHVHKISVKAD